MSAIEATKSVEEPVVAPTETATEIPAVTEAAPIDTAAEPASTETPAVEAPATTEAAPVAEEVKPVEEGILGYKGPGLLKSFMFQKKFFWFGTEAIEHKSLTSYLRGEKNQETANKNAAWSSSTGEGLLFFAKKEADKSSPAGIFNLSEVSDIAEDGTISFSFHQGGHKHTFEASTLAERDNWVAQLKTKAEGAKTLAETVPETEAYKTAHSTLTPPVVAAAVTPKETKEEKKEEKAEEKVEKKDIKEEKKEEKADEKAEKKEVKEEKKDARKSRSASRKRTSIFGGSIFGKKEEKVEAPTVEEPADSLEPVAAVPETSEETAPVVAETAPDSPTTAEKPAVTKRNSIFGTLKGFAQNKDKKTEAEAAPAVPAKDAEPVSETAPVIPAVEASEPLGASVASPATVPTETTEVPVTNGETKTEVPATKSDKRKSSLPFFTKKEKVTEEDGEKTEKPKSPSPFAKLRATVKGKASTKSEKVNEKPTEATTETPEVAEPTTETAPVVSEPESVIASSTPQVSATA